MDRVPAIGGARGVFEIFVPGAFLLLNLATAAYVWPLAPDPVRTQLGRFYANPAVFVLASVTFGYLLGVLLRLLRCETPDHLSAWFLRRVDKAARGGETDKNRYAYEPFPFTRCLKTICEDKMPLGVRRFYETVWPPEATKHFFNLCKLVVASEDPNAAEEVRASEALCRHISGMFYALVASVVVMSSLGAVLWISQGSPPPVVLAVVALYVIAIVVILRNFRLMRLKDVETVFALSYRNRERIRDFLAKG